MNYNNLTDLMSAIGSAIREKDGTSDLIPTQDMPDRIFNIPSSGGYTSIISIIKNMSSNESDGQIASGTNKYSGSYDYYKAFDGNSVTYWATAGVALADTYLQYTAKEIETVSLITMIGSCGTDNIGKNNSFKIDCSIDGNNWNTIVDEIITPKGIRVSYSLDKPASFKYIRFIPLSFNIGSNQVGITDVGLFSLK